MQEDKKTSKGKVNPCWKLRCPQETREDTRRASWKAWFDQVGHKGWRGCFWHKNGRERHSRWREEHGQRHQRLLAVMWYNAQICHWGALVWFPPQQNTSNYLPGKCVLGTSTWHWPRPRATPSLLFSLWDTPRFPMWLPSPYEKI